MSQEFIDLVTLISITGIIGFILVITIVGKSDKDK